MTTPTTTLATLPAVPALDIDLVLGPPSLRVRQEQRVVWALLHHLEAHGWKAAFVDTSDGDREAVTSAKDVMELVFNLDEALVRFAHPEHPKRASVFLVRGNHPTEVVCDYSTAHGFDGVMDGFEPEAVL